MDPDRVGVSALTCCCCRRIFEPRDADPWEGRMDDYCYACSSARCDVTPGECGVDP